MHIRNTPGPNTPIQEQQGSQNSPPRDPLPVLRGVTINLSEIISDLPVADPPVDVESMFNTLDPKIIEELQGSACELPCTSQGEDPKTIKKKKDTNFSGMKYKYQLNSFQVTGSNQEDKDDDASPTATWTQNVLISTIFKNKKMVAKMKSFDLLEGVMVTVLVDPDGYTLLIGGTSKHAIMFS